MELCESSMAKICNGASECTPWNGHWWGEPFGDKSSTWSTWPMILMNYNVLPWLSTKKHFTVLSLIIPSPQLMTSEHFDTYLEPLVKDLKMLWEVGINVQNVGWFRGEPTFNMRAILLWIMHDLLAYGMVAGCTTKEYQGHHCCALRTISRRLIACHNIVYCSQHRRWLPNDHV